MCQLVKDVRWKKVLVCGFIALIIAIVVRQIEAMLTMDYYKMPELFGVWSKLMMPQAGPPGVEFFLVSILSAFLSGTTLAALYEIIRDKLETGTWKRALNFTCFALWLGIIFFTLPVILLINLPLELMSIWFISSAIILFLSSLVFGKILK
ncbi:MAG: hypothetical protein FJZ04_00120 [Candidatus Moranbacteria bacterium]|nr:hypothetical protein [Candidatus Moranbacteria bacterium]